MPGDTCENISSLLPPKMRFFCSRLKYLAGAAALLSLFAAPNAASASITYGTDFSYQENDATSGGVTTSTAQEKFGFDFDMLSAPSSKLTIAGIFRLMS